MLPFGSNNLIVSSSRTSEISLSTFQTWLLGFSTVLAQTHQSQQASLRRSLA